ncbi:MarR family winged helix-turn-helix transcriptional regulator [Kineosporia succinea]|uniref:DNA-binding MarR family transcriptional regulator n=1 Tax=Kineosporia succinea TaxID=84632 RepID=A0ABT9P7X9_9ACTN|nr:MarR family transcriptional regulator [Kineosporia succinea]MDP9828806.1 DNA-binding MarR family transcriptional regulator [Kineosporia succinea]
MPRLVGRAKRLPMPEVLRDFDLAPRHLSLLAYLQHEGRLTVGELSERLELAPTTVSLMVGDLSRGGLLVREEDPDDRRRRIVAVAPPYVRAVDDWLAGSADAWGAVMRELSAEHRAVVVRTLLGYEEALGRTVRDHG